MKMSEVPEDMRISLLTLQFELSYLLASGFDLSDSPGGREYLRVRKEWIDAGRPETTLSFILEHANALRCEP